MSRRVWGVLGICAAFTAGSWFSYQSPVSAQRPAAPSGGELQSHVTPVNDRLQILTLVDPTTRQVCVYHIDLTTGVLTLKAARMAGYDLQLREYNTGNPLPTEIRTLLEQR